MALRIVTQKSYPTTTAQTSAPSAPGVHDTLRSNLSLTSPAPSRTPSTISINPHDAPPAVQSSHPLEARLTAWRATQDNLKMQLLARQFGIAEPVRRGMELRIASAGEWRPAVLGPSARVHGDILAGRDTEISWEDVYTGNELRDVPDFHAEMEAKLKMNW